MNETDRAAIAQPFIEVSNDGMQATLRIPKLGFQVTDKHVRTALSDAGVTFGINEVIVNWVTRSPAMTLEIIVANGIPPKSGRNGWIEYKFNPELATEFGRPDQLHQYSFQNIEAGTLLAIHHNPVPGEAGKTVRGNRVEPAPIKDIAISAGENTNFRNSDNNELLANKAGCTQIDDLGKISVLDHISLMRDVDNSVGDIEYFGDLYIRGDVKSGFSIKTRGKLHVAGTIEDANIEANEVEIQGGFTGSGSGVCRVETDFRAQFVDNQTVYAKNEVHINGEVRNAVIEAGKAIFITGSKGVLIGGRIEAIERIEATVLGNNIDLSCKVNVGRPKEMYVQLDAYEEEISQIDQRSLVMRRQFGIPDDFDLVNDKTIVNKDTPMARSIGLLKKIMDKRQEISTKQQALLDEINRLAQNSCVVVYKACHPGVVIRIGNLTKTIDTLIGHTIFRIIEGEIVGVKE